MSHENHEYQQELEKMKNMDYGYNKVSSSRFLFYVQVIGFVLFMFTVFYELWANRYQGKPDIEIQSSTLYTPQYK
ncbi:hypothetical protein SAMN05192529_102161 [Arachidicoccus rhizosphaerae]|jgi:hypothetical protein|uniref:Uncharacterized protein n=1 Tax=Arachidicoccus rhizosphaerae TaxID=551991 RepID=A0A1H3W832_9BACT|nr:hypothetical protein [Arachidicoccus rhizosphaerae]SDZ82502.1 hypothetical protein SAMN05192529_102161 [Arachidicoccus rhizosphaerae]